MPTRMEGGWASDLEVFGFAVVVEFVGVVPGLSGVEESNSSPDAPAPLAGPGSGPAPERASL